MQPKPDILGLLEARHAKDVWVAECKMGSQWAGCRRLDGWALPKSWSPLTTIGYEIKVDRGDFLRDRKWQEYLPVCHELYFVCPVKLIQPEELPAEVGLIWAGARLVTKRKAVRRQPEPGALVDLMCYVLMSRSRIVGDMWEAQNRESNVDYWRRWLAARRADVDLGRAVGRRLREALAEANRRARRAEDDRERLEGVERKLAELGLSADTTAWQIERKGDAAKLREVWRLAGRISELVGPPA